MNRALLLLSLVASLSAFGCGNDRHDPIKPFVAKPSVARNMRTISDDLINGKHRHTSTASHVLVNLFLNIPYALMFGAAIAYMIAHRRRARAVAAFDPNARLTDGPSVILGVVEPDPNDPTPPVRVVIAQHGTEQKNKNGWSHTWSEVDRTVVARPFLVRRPDGSRVRVEPDERVAVRDDLSKVEVVARDMRRRVAEVTPGEEVHVTGDMFATHKPASAYRGSGAEPVMRPPRGGRMTISTELPGNTEASRSRFHRGWAIAIAIVYSVMFLFVTLPYQVLLIEGETSMAKVVSTERWFVWVKPKNQKGYWSPRYNVSARVGSEIITDECSQFLLECAERGECAEVPITRASTIWSVAMLGRGAAIDTWQLVLLIISTGILIIAYPASVVSSRPWYMVAKVNDYGSGRLPDV